MDIAIIGTGAIGGYYGVRLALAGHRVHFLAHSEYEAIKAGGLRVDSYLGEFAVPAPLVYDDPAKLPPCDLVCVTVKATANAEVFGKLGSALKPDGSIILMQNGFGWEPELARLYPQAKLYAGLCFICSFREAPGVVRHTAYGSVTVAPYQAGQDGQDGAEALRRLFEEAGVEATALADAVSARFHKLVWNIPYNGLTTVLGCTTAELAADPAARHAARRLMDEVVEAAAACGVAISERFVNQMEANTDNMPAYNPSMRLDHLAGRPLEVEAMFRNVIACAAEHGYQMRRAELLADELDFLSA
ncbi:MAG: 2-dehydropantoate 2-reductase [Propionibacteriaceae bacterium]|jgi:2-dehydropantoate 2-reductase|nr:2-dehydropantoate 2-reductase [Propionibacteriaceae bacterium]